MVDHDMKECPYCRTDVLEEKPSPWKRRNISILISSGILFSAGIIFQLLTSWETGNLILFLGSALITGPFIAKEGLKGLLERRLDVNILMISAAIGAFSIGYAAEGAGVLFLYFGAETLEDYAGERVRGSIGKLLKLAPETAIVKTETGKKEVHSHEVEIGDIIIVKPGERIPLDGTVKEGKTSVNQSAVTGESVAVSKNEGDDVFAGTLNEEGYIEVEVTKPPGETTLSKIINLVEVAQEEKSETQSLVNRVANYYTPLVLILAISVATIPVLVFSQPVKAWVYRSLILLAVSCPCAFVLSTPITMVSGITSAARNGLLIKGGSYIEGIKDSKVLAFDKTQTLTEGNPEVTEFIRLNDSEENILRAAVTLESKTKHPLSKAILGFGKGRRVEPGNVEEFESVPGEGIIGTIDGEKYLMGGLGFLDKHGVEYPKQKVKRLEEEGKSVIAIGKDEKAVALFAVKDRIREDAREVLKKLRDKDIKTVMLTGDNEKVAKAIADELGIDEYHAEMLPEEKAEIIEELAEKYGHVSMVGDGVNDAPALAEANVGIAMGAAGSDVAIETADIVLMEDDLSKISYFWELSGRTMSRIKENIAVSLIVKGALAVMAVFGLITLSIAVGIGDMGISLLVIINALRLGIH